MKIAVDFYLIAPLLGMSADIAIIWGTFLKSKTEAERTAFIEAYAEYIISRETAEEEEEK